MGRKVKERAFEEEGSAIGHNSGDTDRADMETTRQVKELEHKKEIINGQIKDILVAHKKKYGTPRGSIRYAVKELNQTPEKAQSDKEVTQHGKHIVQLFANSDGQYSWMKEHEAA